MRALGCGNFIQADRSIVHFTLHFQHFAESGFEHGQHALDFLFAKLTQYLLQLGLGLFQFLDGLFLIFCSAFLLGFFQFLFGVLHAFLRRFQPFSQGSPLLIAALLILPFILSLVIALAAILTLPLSLPFA